MIDALNTHTHPPDLFHCVVFFIFLFVIDSYIFMSLWGFFFLFFVCFTICFYSSCEMPAKQHLPYELQKSHEKKTNNKKKKKKQIERLIKLSSAIVYRENPIFFLYFLFFCMNTHSKCLCYYSLQEKESA